MMKIHMVAMVMVQNLDSDAEDLQNLVDEEMNRSHQSDQDEYLSDSDGEEYDHQEDGVDEEEATMDLKNVLKARFKAYLDWDDDMDVPNIPDSDSNSDAIFINPREICSRGRPQINRNRSSRQNIFGGSRYYDVYDEDQSSQGRSGGGRRGLRESRGGDVWGGRGSRGDDANVSNHPTVYQFL
ncbi:hypothetical protein FXO37_34297 [Capsicum annuum]|nr:hypothetical protein FXO37_34297 [Capsicum annuum]